MAHVPIGDQTFYLYSMQPLKDYRSDLVTISRRGGVIEVRPRKKRRSSRKSLTENQS